MIIASIPNRKVFLANLWVLTLLLYFLRTIVSQLKIPFIASFIVLSFLVLWISIKNLKHNLIKDYFYYTKEFHILGLFLIIGILLTRETELLSLKSLINYIGISILFLIYFEIKEYVKIDKILIYWITATTVIGIIGIIKWTSFIMNLDLNFLSTFYKYGTSLVPEYNLHASYFIFSFIILLYALQKRILRRKVIINQLMLLIFVLNIALSSSRRGLIILTLILIIFIILFLRFRYKMSSSLIKNLKFLYFLISVLLLLIITFSPYRAKFINKDSMRNNITISLYRYSKIFKPNSEFRTFEKKIWPQSSDYEHIQVNWDKYATYNNKIDNVIINPYNDLKKTFWDKFSNSKIDSPNNLIYNGNFDYGLKFWDTIAPDSIGHKIIHTKYGNAIRISRGKGTGYWSLIYNGRNIYFYEDVEYILHFKFRVITGSGIPFYVGFRLNEGNGYIYNLPKTVTEISNGWHQYTVKYKFKASHENLIFFLNSQKPNTVIDITDIILTSNDDLDRHPYRNQVLKIHGTNLLYNSNFENGLKFWSSFSPDSIGHELIETEHGTAVRINRGNGKGFWQLTYEGRDIFYHKGLTYYFRFKYRVINGSSIPFYIGWWYKDNDEYVNNVPKRIYPLGNDWYECITKYTFKENHFNRTKLFLNTLDPNTTIDVTDIELICTDSLTSKLYADENTNLISKSEEQEVKEIINEENDPFLSSRIKRWDFALTYFQNYKWHEKFIGGGFDYLETFGKKFFPDQGRKDYPHNPIISSFLYSGITGGVAYIYYLMLSFIYYWRYRKKIGIFLILYSVIFIFIFLSSDSHFNTPIFAFLSLIPFIARYNIYQRENRNQHK